jgi:hypothetical protein
VTEERTRDGRADERDDDQEDNGDASLSVPGATVGEITRSLPNQ